MSISEELINALRCNFDGRDHFLIDAFILPCGHSICKECASDNLNKELKCEYSDCNRVHNIKKLEHLKVNPTIPVLIKTYEKELFEYTKKEFEKLSSDLEAINNEEALEKCCQEITEKIEKRGEELKSQLDTIGEDLRGKLTTAKEEMSKIVSNEKFNEQKKMLEEKLSNFNYEANFYDLQNEFIEIQKNFNDFSKIMPKVLFKVSEAELSEGIIGHIGKEKVDECLKPPPTYYYSDDSW